MASSQVRQYDNTPWPDEPSERGEPARAGSPAAAAAARWQRREDGLAAPHDDAAALRRSATAVRPSARAIATTRAPHTDGGLTAAGAGCIAVLATSFAAIIDAGISPGLGLFFDFIYLAVTVVVAGRVSRRDAWAATMLPPLVFVAAAGVAAQVAPVSTGGWLDRTSADMLAAVVNGWVPLFLGVILAAAVMVRRRMMR